MVWESIRDLKTVGVIRHDPDRRMYEIAWPMGVVAAFVPSTNPTSTVFFKTLIAVKARNAIVLAPHPAAARCYEAATTMAQAAEQAGAPERLIGCMQHVSLEGTQELMRHRRIALILATGGTPMVSRGSLGGQTGLRCGPGQRTGLCRPQRGHPEERLATSSPARLSTARPSARRSRR